MEIIDGLSKFAAMDGKRSVQTQEEEAMMSMRHSENNSEREQDPKFICSLIYYCLLLPLLGFNYACSEQLFVVWAEYACIPF